MPGRTYQLVSTDALGSPWSNVPESTTSAGPLQLYLSYTDIPPSSVTQRFYRIKLIP